MLNKFAKILKELRISKNLTQTEFAKEIKTTQRKISYWESSKVEPDIDFLWIISDYFKISVDELIGKN